LKTDSLFYRIFQASPGILFELLGQSPDLAQGYRFDSVEVKQVAFRLDGVFLPKTDAIDQTIIFLEVQFQKDPNFYHRFFAEIHLFLKLHPSTFDWMAVVIFPGRSVEPLESTLFRNLINSDQVHRIYLEDLPKSNDSVGLGLMRLIVMEQNEAIAQAKDLFSRTQQRAVAEPQLEAIIKLIETVIVYKFPKLSWEAIEKMFGLSEFKQTRVYQEAVEEGEQRGEQRGERTGAVREARSLVLRQLSRRVGTLPPSAETQVQALALPQLEALGEALLDFTQLDDLTDWLQENS
jgi:predicted transposase/invertase (TIGR01784 family)